jgi:hypothetical protein
VVPSREGRLGAQILVAAPAESTATAGVGQPRDSDPVTRGETRAVGTELVDDADDLVAWDDVWTVDREIALGDMEVGSAHAAGGHPDPDLARTGLGRRAFHHAQGLPVQWTG